LTSLRWAQKDVSANSIHPINREATVTFEAFPYIKHAAGGETERLSDVWSARGNEIDALLLRHGAILFKGFAIGTVERFNELMGSLPLSLGDGVDGNSPQTKLSEAVHSSAEYPAELPISLYNEHGR
jgi:hypothetical protein